MLMNISTLFIAGVVYDYFFTWLWPSPCLLSLEVSSVGTIKNDISWQCHCRHL